MEFTTPLVSAAALRQFIDDPNCFVFDVRHELNDFSAGQRAYTEGHLPNAYFLAVETDLSGPKNGTNGRHPLPDPAILAARLSELGVRADSRIVAYDAHGGAFAARLWWLLQWMGHEAVSVLDGGLNAWVRAGGELVTAVPEPRSAAPGAALLNPRAVSHHTRATVNAEQLRLHPDQFRLIDARAPERYRGEVEPIDPVAGHIPGALNHFFKNNLNADETFKSSIELRSQWQALLNSELNVSNKIVHYCGSGVTACHNVLACEIAGIHGTGLYPGSWSEWCSQTQTQNAAA